MFEKYVPHHSKYLELDLPAGKERMFVSEDGQILSLEKGEYGIGYDEKGNKTIRADLWDGPGDYLVSLIVIVAYGKCRLPEKYYKYIEPFHIDGNKRNTHVGNLGYRFTQLIECETSPGYYHIPFFSRYVINREGELLNAKTKETINTYVNKPRAENNKKNITGGYYNYSIHNDVCKQTIGRYRLMALTFIPYPDDVDKLDVNHIDGDPANDTLDNLEWATRTRNNIHAVESGLRSQNIPVYAKNVYNGEELEFASFAIADRHFNLCNGQTCQRTKPDIQTLYEGGWMFKLNKDTPWRIVENPEKELKEQSTPTKTISKNIFTGEIKEHYSLTQAARDLNLPSEMAVRHQVSKNRNRPYHGYLFRTEFDNTPWPEFNERQLAIFRDNPVGRARGVIARNDKGEELFFTNIKNAAKAFPNTLGSRGDVCKAIDRKRIVEGYRLHYYQCPLME